ncbi:Uma2 family endonuclease [Bacillus sp. FJAT-29937]|uniref:Uma2 family endonuclease n=1 Tax=Bacillus sp. FJAT-29937 TaxID=1720553 RepID=UPI0008299DE9|nr:Uma2 family endonuclease [Bacillus sp. FJAT-29937]
MVFNSGERKSSYADYLSWGEGERIEIIDGDMIRIPPAHFRKHQQVLRELSIEFSLFLREKEGEAYFAPFEVRLQSEKKADDEVYNFVQPDLTVVIDSKKLDEKGCRGTPDLIVEILSPTSVKLDRWKKYQLYERAGVKEYWIVDAMNESIEVYVLDDQKYVVYGVFTREEAIQVPTLRGLEIDLNQIFKYY